MKIRSYIVLASLLLVGCNATVAKPSNEQIAELQAINEGLKREVTDLNQRVQTCTNQQPPTIQSVEFLSPSGELATQDFGWVTLGDTSIIRVVWDGLATKVDLLFAPTGTDSWKLQRVVQSVPVGRDQKEVRMEWDAPPKTIGYIWVMVYNGYAGRRSESVNVIRQ